jgi:hypothetical protein
LVADLCEKRTEEWKEKQAKIRAGKTAREVLTDA